jgi:endoglucanase
MGEVKLGLGPVLYRGPNINPKVFQRLVSTARAKKIPHQVRAEPRGTGTDANAIQLSRAGVATGLVSIPNRYMHSPCEIVSLDDLDWTADLLAHFVAGVRSAKDFIPFGSSKKR